MLGQDASFAYIKAVELCAATGISQKKAGYLAGKIDTTSCTYMDCLIIRHCFYMTASLFLSPDHEFRFMLVNQIQRDMKRLATKTYMKVFITTQILFIPCLQHKCPRNIDSPSVCVQAGDGGHDPRGERRRGQPAGSRDGNRPEEGRGSDAQVHLSTRCCCSSAVKLVGCVVVLYIVCYVN